jgi:hypothetical protein
LQPPFEAHNSREAEKNKDYFPSSFPLQHRIVSAWKTRQPDIGGGQIQTPLVLRAGQQQET